MKVSLGFTPSWLWQWYAYFLKFVFGLAGCCFFYLKKEKLNLLYHKQKPTALKLELLISRPLSIPWTGIDRATHLAYLCLISQFRATKCYWLWYWKIGSGHNEICQNANRLSLIKWPLASIMAILSFGMVNLSHNAPLIFLSSIRKGLALPREPPHTHTHHACASCGTFKQDKRCLCFTRLYSTYTSVFAEIWWVFCPLLYKLRTWLIHSGLEPQTSSPIITNHWRSPY